MSLPQTMQTEKKAQIIDAFKQGMSWRECGESCSISPSTIWRWAQADPDFAGAIKAAGADADAEVEAVTFRNATDPDPAHNTLRMFWLKSRMPHRYKERVDHEGGLTIRVEYADHHAAEAASGAGEDPRGDEAV